jgi:predicted Zn finger-like uncharacterized protein
MKFVCNHCKAKYQLADEKVAGRTLRMTCRSCGQEIVIRSDPTQQAAASLRAPAASPPPPPPGVIAASVARSSLTAAPRVAAPPAAGYVSLPGAAPLGARSSLASAPRVAPPPPPSPLGADFRAAAQHAPSATVGPPDEWHVAIDDQPIGPIHRDEVARKIAAGAAGPDSLAWREGLDDWMPIRDIPELFVLCRTAGPASAMVGALPPTIGGRAGAAPGFAVEDWAPVHDSSARHAAPAMAMTTSTPSMPSEAELAALRGPRMPSLPVLFAMVGGLAFMMSIVAILGARYLAKDNGTGVAPQPAPVVQMVAPAPPAPKETVIELDEQVLDAPADEGRPRGSGSGTGRTTSSTKPKKELTEAQRAMLARMGGDGASLSDLATKSAQGSTGPARGGGSLTASELSSVVNRNKKQLQRCYETALRGSGSDDTVRLDVSITIAPSGGISAVQLAGNGLPGMNECIERTVRTWRFPSAGEATPMHFPLLFQPGA